MKNNQHHSVEVVDKDSQLSVGKKIFHGVGSEQKALDYSQLILESGEGQVECIITYGGEATFNAVK